jgi:hypothetical protein
MNNKNLRTQLRLFNSEAAHDVRCTDWAPSIRVRCSKRDDREDPHRRSERSVAGLRIDLPFPGSARASSTDRESEH